jgi:tetratricopeptide (TPR) repeat protein
VTHDFVSREEAASLRVCHLDRKFSAIIKPAPELRGTSMLTTRLLHKAGLIIAAAFMTFALAAKPAAAIGTDNPPAPSDSGSKKSDKKKSEKKKEEKGSNARSAAQKLADQKFLDGYRAARELILAGNYGAGIAAMHALGHDEHPDVANYIGYANRKLGNYDASKFWYEAALTADPNHVRTWSYYGMWQAEQGNRLKAEDDLAKVKLICGNTTCKEYTELKAVIDGKASY